jgi:CHAT domain-containing protein/Tfp pilus assembly protein PilF
MICPHSRSTQSKYRPWLVYCGLVLSVGLPLIQIQASPDALWVGKEVKHYAGMVSPAQEKQQTQQLESGKPIERELTGSHSHSYQMTLATGQYVKLVVAQRGIDVVVKLFGPDGNQITEFDSEVRLRREETVDWVAEEAGNYRLDVVAKYKNTAAGGYEIKLVELRVATDNDRALHEARMLITEFLRLYHAAKNDEALLLVERVLEIRERVLGPEHIDVADALNKLALINNIKGNFEKAEPFYQRALTIREKVLEPEHPFVAFTLANLANLYYERGDYAKAEPFYLRALAIMEKVLESEHPFVADSLNNLASLYYERGDYAKAEPFHLRALAIKEKVLGLEHPVVADSLNNLAALYEERGDYAKAEPFHLRALAIKEKVLGPEHPHVIVSLNNLASLYYSRGDYAKAEPFYLRALAIREKVLGPEHHLVAHSLNDLAVLYVAKGDIAQAVTFLSRTNAADERNLALNLDIGSERQKLIYLSKFSKRTDFTLSLQSQAAPNDPRALDLAFTTLLRRKARGLDVMTDTIATLRRHATPQDQERFNKLADARSRLAAFALKAPDADNYDTYRKSIEELEAKVDELEAELSSGSIGFRAQTQPVTLSAVQAALPGGSALVEFAYFTPLDPKTYKSTSPRYLAYLLPAQGPPKWVDLGEAAPIDRAVEAWRKALRSPNRTDVQRLARAVDERVIRPVRSLLSGMQGDTRRLLIAPDGSLNLIPFAALVDERDRHLIERYSISYLTSGRDLLRMQTPQPSNTPPLVVANPDFGGFATIALRGGRNSAKSRTSNRARAQIDPTQFFFQPLPATEDEALAIKALLPQASVLRREEATETALKQANSPQILHIATHGFFLNYQDPSPAKDTQLNIGSPGINAPAPSQAAPYTVQLEATPALETAREKVKELRAQGVDAYILKSRVKGKGTLFRVRVGNFPTQAEANRRGAELQGKGILSQFFVARYQPPQRELMEPAPTIAGAPAKSDNSTTATASPANSRPVAEPTSDLRLSKFAAQIKNPLLRSGLALAGANHGKSGDDDGVLTALEASYLDLSGTKLVVLSACDTGVGEVKNGEGVQGLRRALVLAGSESQVMSLWPVSDEATKDLMTPYYKALQQGEGRSEGLRQVQLRMLRGRKDRRHPFYWAAFIQSGEWTSLDGQK